MSTRELERAPEANEERERPELDKVWARRGGIGGWLAHDTSHAVGLRYIVTAFVFLFIAGIEAMLMRLQLARPEFHLLNPDLYNQVFTMHGTTMMFLFAVPVMQGMGVYLVPMMVGTRNVAFPRLNVYGYYMYVFGGIFIYVMFLFNTGADAGWFAYTPLSGPQFSPGKRVDVWAQMITFTEISSLCAATSLIGTIFRQRAPGMSLNRMPVYVWSMLVQSFMVIFAMPAIMIATSCLILDRLVGTHFFNPAEGGDPLFWQHLFWFFGHPEVYIIFVPAQGFVSSIIVAFARRPMFGYTAVVLSQIAIGFIGFGLWVHHMFATGLPKLGEGFFSAASMMIAIPSGVQIFCWLATLWSGRIRLSAAMHFVLGFIFIFVAGGLTGVMLAAVPFDLQAHDTYFVVAHFHYVLIGGAVFPLIGAIYFWFPKMTGRMMNERIGKLNFWLLFSGFNLTFFPMHVLGLYGMPRRVYTYPGDRGWTRLNELATVGALIILAGGLLLLYNAIRSYRGGRLAGNDPWKADTLEWCCPSPPHDYNFIHLPTVDSRAPLWTRTESTPVVTGLRTDRRELLMTTLLDAAPDHRSVLAPDSAWPFLAACASSFGLIGSVFDQRWVPPGALLSLITFIGWFWPRRDEKMP